MLAAVFPFISKQSMVAHMGCLFRSLLCHHETSIKIQTSYEYCCHISCSWTWLFLGSNEVLPTVISIDFNLMTISVVYYLHHHHHHYNYYLFCFLIIIIITFRLTSSCTFILIYSWPNSAIYYYTAYVDCICYSWPEWLICRWVGWALANGRRIWWQHCT